MPLFKLQFRPGINRDTTNYANEGGWYDCDKIRFRSGYPQKLGGWVKSTPNQFYGVCRQMWNWSTTYADNLLALGTNNKVYIEAGGYLNDITPLRAANPTLGTPATDNCIETTAGSNIVRVNIVGHGAETGSFVTIAGVTGTVGGLPNSQINGNKIITVLDADSFTIEVISDAGSSVAMGGGTAITVSFEITPGNRTITEGYGWGTGTWGRGSWGLGAATPVLLPQQDWWLDNFDNDLAMNIRNGAPYWWQRGTNTDPSSALETRAITLQALATAESNDPDAVPAKVMQLLVSQNDKHLIAFGAVPFGSTNINDFDPLLIRWSDQDAPSQWTPSLTNSAGDIRISRGSAIIRALPVRQEILVWTDSTLYSFQFLGDENVFGLQEYAGNISIISSRAVATGSDVTFWMGRDKFYSYAGRVETLACTLLDYVFKDINLGQADQVVAGTNEEWSEVWWFYPSANSNWNNRYVVFNYLENLWYYGTMERTAWLDTPLREYLQAANTGEFDTKGFIYSHENGTDDDIEAMSSFIESSDYDLGDGDQFVLTRRLIPDVTFAGSSAAAPEVTFSLIPRDFPGSAPFEDVGDSQQVIQSTVGQYTNQVFIRARARQMAMRLASTGLGVQWQLGSPRVDGRMDAKR